MASRTALETVTGNLKATRPPRTCATMRVTFTEETTRPRPWRKKANILVPVPPCSMKQRLPTPKKSEEIARKKLFPIGLPQPPRSVGPSGLRPQHIKGSLLLVYRDELMRSLHAVVRIMAKGNIPGRRWLPGCQRLAHCLDKEDGSHRPVPVGETPQERLSSHRPRHQAMAPETRQRRNTVPLDHGRGDLLPPN